MDGWMDGHIDNRHRTTAYAALAKHREAKTVHDRAIFTMADQQKVACGLSNGAIFNDLEKSLTQFSRSGYSWLRGTMARTSDLSDDLSLSYTRPTADG